MAYILSISYRNLGVSKKTAEDYFYYFIDNNISQEHIFFDQNKQTELAGTEMSNFLENYSKTQIDIVFYSKDYPEDTNCINEIKYLINKYQSLQKDKISIDNRLFIIQCDKKRIIDDYPSLNNNIFISDNIDHCQLKTKIFKLTNNILRISIFNKINSIWSDKLSKIKLSINPFDKEGYTTLINNQDNKLIEIIKGTKFYADISDFFKQSNILLLNGALSFGKSLLLKQLENDFKTITTQCYDVKVTDIEHIKSFDDLSVAIHTDLRKHSSLQFRNRYISDSEIRNKLNPNRRVANKIDLFLIFLKSEIIALGKSITLIVNLDNIERFCDINAFKELNENLILKENQDLYPSKDINLIIITRYWPSKISNTKFVKNILPLDYNDCYNLFYNLFHLEGVEDVDIPALISFILDLTNGTLWLLINLYSTYLSERLQGNILKPYSLLIEIIGDYKKILYKKNGELVEFLKKSQHFIIKEKIKNLELRKILSIENHMTQDEIEKFSSSKLLKFLGLIIPENINWDEYNKVNLSYIFLLHRQRLIEKIKSE